VALLKPGVTVAQARAHGNRGRGRRRQTVRPRCPH
jgi:hypothetical protein